MPKFAVYFIPAENDPFYQLGSQILGYDVRRRRLVTTPATVTAELGELDPNWVTEAVHFGFHLTICDALDCDWATIPNIERRLEDLLFCFGPDSVFTLQRRRERPVGIWQSGSGHCLALLYEPNVTLSILHALLVGCINPMGKGSGYLQEYLKGSASIRPHTAKQVQLFSSPNILDNWTPHFTLLNPYAGSDPPSMALRLARLSEAYSTLTIQSLCLLVQERSDDNWFIYREVSR
jgi:hypothetical protein